MRKLIVIMCSCIIVALSSDVFAQQEREEVTLSRCIDGDTAAFIVDGEEEKVRFLAINAPEYTKEKEAYGKEASEYVCDRLNEAEVISFEYEPSNMRDKYDRLLAWIFVDGELLQAELVEQGLAEVKYIYGDYVYTDELYGLEDEAKSKQLNMWSGVEPEEEKDLLYYAGIVGIVILMVFVALFKKTRKKSTLNKLSKELKKRM